MTSFNKAPRLYAVEFLRIAFILCVILGHLKEIRLWVASLLHSSGLPPVNYAVEFFFIIGGFFLYNNLTYSKRSAGDMIRKIYFRLLPGTLFALSLAILFGITKLGLTPASLAQLAGIGFLKHGIIKWGDWYIGVYFWTSCLLIGLWQMKPHHRWLCIGALVYIALMLRLRGTFIPDKAIFRKDIDAVYTQGLISAGFLRGIACMGIGMIFSFLSNKITFSAKWFHKLIFTLFEVACIVSIYNSLWNTKHFHSGYVGMLLLMGCFMVIIAHNWGYISTLLNKCSWIIYASRYTLPTLFGHMVCLSILHRHHHFGWNGYEQGIFVICGAILLGIIEYHLVEKWLVPIIKNHLHKHSSLSPQEP